MLSTHKARLIAFAAAIATLGGGLFVYMTPASTNVNAAPIEQQPGIASDATIAPWSSYLSERAVNSGGIENDLDGNASSLFPSDFVRATGGLQ